MVTADQGVDMNALWAPIGSMPELPWLWAGVLMCLAATGLAWAGLRAPVPAHDAPGARGQRPWRVLELALVLVAVGLAQRWWRLGHGPFLDMFEILASSLLSLGLIAAWASRRDRALRAAAPVVLSLLALMGLWLLVTDPADTHLPATYQTPVLWFHVLLGKLFLGCALWALGLAGLVLMRRTRLGARCLLRLPGDDALDSSAWRVMQFALLFESLMLVAGAVWAQDAWGRYWAWDPLETWAFLTWLLLVGALHARRSMRLSSATSAWLVVAVFTVAFLTFFGVPFVSVAPHKGAV
jgi:ABC-type transport system involved in cytochrome c biogenesis permease subunit